MFPSGSLQHECSPQKCELIYVFYKDRFAAQQRARSDKADVYTGSIIKLNHKRTSDCSRRKCPNKQRRPPCKYLEIS